MKKLGCGLLLVLCMVGGAFVALVLFGRTLPDAAPRSVAMAAATRSGEVTIVQPSSSPSPAVRQAGAPLAIPVAGVAAASIQDNWGDPRDNGLRAHHGTDIMAPGGTPVIAAAPGTVEKLWTSAAGGTTVYVRSPRRLWTYYYAHLAGYAPGLHEGQVVRVGDQLGYVGDTGNAGARNFHLHFGLARTTPDQHWYEGEDIDPYPYLVGKPVAR